MVLVCTRTFHYIVLLQVAATSCFTPDRIHRIDSTYCYTDIVVWVSVCLYVSVMGTTMSSAKQLIQSRCRLGGGAVPCAPRNQMEMHIGAAGRIRGGDAALSQTTVTICFTTYHSYRPFPAFFSLRGATIFGTALVENGHRRAGWGTFWHDGRR